MSRSLRGAALGAALLAAGVATAAPPAVAAGADRDRGRTADHRPAHGWPGHGWPGARGGTLRAERLEAEHDADPLGLGVARPRLGWRLDAGGRRGAESTGYRVVVWRDEPGRASHAGGGGGGAVVWDSGTVRDSGANEVRYGGPALASRTRYAWRVRALDERGRPGPWSRTATMETGLLRAEDWRGQWIGAPGADEAARGFDLAGTSWIWFPEAGDPLAEAPAGTRWFRTEATLPAGVQVRRAQLVVDADDGFTAWVNGREVSSTDPNPDAESWQRPQLADVTRELTAGANAIAVQATNGRPSPAGMFARLLVETAAGERIVVDSDATWRVSDSAPATDAWTRAGFDDDAQPWVAARRLAAWGAGPWGQVRPVRTPDPEPLLRRSFALDGRERPVRARLYASGLAYADVTLNGRRLSDAVLDPAFSRYDRRIHAVTRDVTDVLRRGENVLGVRLGRGFFGLWQPNAWNWHTTPWTAEPRVRAQLELTYRDGRVETIATDGAWRTHDGPTRSDSLYAGETYDARAEQPGWDAPGFDAAGWEPAAVLRAPTGTVQPQAIEPIEVTETLRPTRVTSPRAGTYVFELPRVMAGWARIRVRGEAGRTVTLRYGEKLNPDGTVIHGNYLVMGDSQTDRYTLAGRPGGETWEPRYSYKGFRYVQVDGWPGERPPTVRDLDGRVVHTALREAGEFESSDPLLNRMRQITRDTLTNNFHGLPTDTPLYEKNGWTGDAMVLAETYMLEYDMRRVLPKWIDDVADSQKPNGQVPLIAPDSGWGNRDDNLAAPWNAAFLRIPWLLYERYGDADVLAEHWDGMRRAVDLQLARVRADGTVANILNDYLAPGFGANSPEDASLAGTAYAYLNTRTLADIAQALGKGAEAASYRAAAARLRDAFNAAYLNDARDAYVTPTDGGYRQTSALLALAFGLVPAADEARVEARLVAEIRAKGNHLDTGALGTRELLPELTRRGHGELAWAVVMNPTYPSFRHIVDNGATTWWEGWETTVRSYDHAFVQGPIDQWMYEWVAGIRPLAPGYARALVSPTPVGDLRSARGAVETPHGRLAATWRRDGRAFSLEVRVPVGVTALVDVPAGRAADVREGGLPLRWADGVRVVAGAPEGRVRLEVGSGTYRFSARR